MSDVIVKIKLTQAQAGALYMKSLALEDELMALKELCKEASDYLDTNNLTTICHNSILHAKFKAVNDE